MLRDEAPSTPRRSIPATSPANVTADTNFCTPVKASSTTTTTTSSTSPQPRTPKGRQGLTREEDEWSHDTETAIFSIYSMYGVSVREPAVEITDTPSTPVRASQISPKDVVHLPSDGDGSPASSSAAHNGGYQYHDRRPTKEQLEAFSFGSAPAPGHHFSKFSDDSNEDGSALDRSSMYSTELAYFDTGAGVIPGPLSPSTSDDGEERPFSMVSEEGTIESAVVVRLNEGGAPPSSFSMSSQDWVTANPRLSFQLGTILTVPPSPSRGTSAEDGSGHPTSQPQDPSRPESRLTLDLDPVIPQRSSSSPKVGYGEHRLRSAASGTHLQSAATTTTPVTADSAYQTPLTSTPTSTSEGPFFSPEQRQHPLFSSVNANAKADNEDHDRAGQPSSARLGSNVGLGISQPPQSLPAPLVSSSARPTLADEQDRAGYPNGDTGYSSHHQDQDLQRGDLEMPAHHHQTLSSSLRPSAQHHHHSINGHGNGVHSHIGPSSTMMVPSTPRKRSPSPASQSHTGRYQSPQSYESASQSRTMLVPAPMAVTSPSPQYPPSAFGRGHSPSRPSPSRTPQSHSPAPPSRTETPVRGGNANGHVQGLGPATNGIGHHAPVAKTPSRTQLHQPDTLNPHSSPSRPSSRISHSAQSSRSTTHRNPSPSYHLPTSSINTPYINYSPPPNDPAPQPTLPPISISHSHSREDSTSTTSHTQSQLSQTPSNQSYSNSISQTPSTQSHQCSQYSSTSTGASQSQYQPSMSNGYYQGQYEEAPSLPTTNRALQLHLAVHNGSPSRPSSSKGAAVLSTPPKPPTLKGKPSAGSLAPSLVPSAGEEPDAFHVRNTYAQLEVYGVKGDGYEEGVERTRAARSRAESAHPTPRTNSSPGHTNGTAEPESRPTAQRTKSQLLADEAIADDNEKKRELSPAELKLLGSVDRYGFFTIPTHERYIVMPSQPFLKPFAASFSSPSLGASSSNLPPPKSLNQLPQPVPHPKETARIEKWNRMLVPHARDEGGNVQAWRVRPSKVSKVRRRVYKGVPDRWRAAVWEMLMSAFVVGHEHSSDKAVDVPRLTSRSEAATRGVKDIERSAREYRDGIERPSTYDVQIDLDVPRTISGHIMFRTRYGAGQRSLFHVLHAFSLVCPQCGYVQGMGPIAATLLSYLPPSLSYTALVRLHTSYNMHTIFSPGFPGLLEAIYVQEQITKTYMPNVYEAFKKHMVSSTSYATKWYITLFAGVVPWQVMLRLWDVFWLEGSDVFVGVAVSVLWVYRDQITSPQANFETILSLLSSFFVPEDEDPLLNWLEKMLGDTKLRNSMKAWRIQWRELVRTGKDGDALL